jgi:hypothetical protein
MSEAPAVWTSGKRSGPTENGAEHPAALNGSAQEREARFKLVPFDAIKVGRGRSYLVRDLIPREGVVVVWGPPKCGKTFWTFDVVMHIAAGWPEYRGKRVEAGTVVYVACEGERGLAARVEAFRRGKMAESASGASFSLISTRLDLVEDHADLINDIRAQLGRETCSVLVIDTLNRSIRGSESDDAVMGAYVRAADALREAFGCAVLVIHHCGIDTTRPRGHTSLTGAADAQIKVSRDKSGRISTEVEWMKDGPEGAKTLSTLEVIEVGDDEDGKPITSCIVQPCDDDEAETSTKRLKLPDAARVALEMLKKAVAEAGVPGPSNRTIPKDTMVVKVDLWRRYADTGSVSDSEKPDAKRKAFKRAVDTLQARGAVGVWNGLAWIKPGAAT